MQYNIAGIMNSKRNDLINFSSIDFEKVKELTKKLKDVSYDDEIVT